MSQHVTLIGFGEAGQAFAGAEGWRGRPRAYDKLTDDPRTCASKESDYGRASVEGVRSLADAVLGSNLIISLVTADQALSVATGASHTLRAGALFCDMNSVAPSTKRLAAAAVERAGGHYIDVAIMAPVNPARLSVPLLLSGPESPVAARKLSKLGFSSLRVVGPSIGQASAIKMIRSVLVKGIEALTAEAMIAAQAAGVTEDVLASLDASEQKIPWAKRADRSLERMLVHGLRRAEEMEEVVKTLEDLGVKPLMTLGTVQRQREIGSLRLRPAAGLVGKIEQIEFKAVDAA